jgi:hypothetical protein
MESAPPQSLRFRNFRAVFRALATKKSAAAASELRDAGPGRDGTVVRFTCPECGKGYVEATAHFKVSWLNKKEERKVTEESWLVASVKMTPEEMEPFARDVSGGG